MKTLVCKIDNEVVAYGEMRVYEEFIYVDIPYMNTFVFSTVEDFINWLNKSKAWQLAN